MTHHHHQRPTVTALPAITAATGVPGSRDTPASGSRMDPLPDIDELAQTEARMVRELAGLMANTKVTADLCLARTQNLLGDGVSGIALPHIQACGLLSTRLIAIYDRGVRTFGEHRRGMTALAARQQAAAPDRR